MICYGLTGKTGAGKSTAAAWLRDKGWYVIDGDLLAREIMLPGSPVLRRIADAFGEDLLLPDGNLDRKGLVQRLRGTENGVALLNAYTHCVFDAAALLESPSKARCQKIIVVTAPPEIRLQRILSRDGLSEAQANARMAMQKDDEWYLSQADYIIRNYPPYTLEDELSKVIACPDANTDEN